MSGPLNVTRARTRKEPRFALPTPATVSKRRLTPMTAAAQGATAAL